LFAAFYSKELEWSWGSDEVEIEEFIST